jgi:hypothetical protein
MFYAPFTLPFLAMPMDRGVARMDTATGGKERRQSRQASQQMRKHIGRHSSDSLNFRRISLKNILT